MSDFDIKQIVSERLGENYELHEKYINPTLVKVFRTISFDNVYTKAKGQYLWDKEGNRYLDMLSGFGVYSISRSSAGGASYPRRARPGFAQHGADGLRVPGGAAGRGARQTHSAAPRLCFFCNSGTEAVEASLKFARAATGRSKFAYLDHGWHGLSLGSLAIMGNEEFREGFGEMLPGVEVPYGDLDALEKALAKKDIAALAVECIQGKGVRIPPPDYLPAAQALAGSTARCFFATKCRRVMGGPASCSPFSIGTWNPTSSPPARRSAAGTCRSAR